MTPRAPITSDTIQAVAAEVVGQPITPTVAAEQAAAFEPLMALIASLRALPLKELEPPALYRPEEDA
ncbi:MAG: hypothetical protein ACRELA_03650 [Candidatus Rokuibacteriota bacterium]